VTPYALAVVDLNRDGKIDIVVGNVEARSTIYWNDGSGHTHPVWRYKNAVYDLAIAELDRNGLLDIVAARSNAQQNLRCEGYIQNPSKGLHA